MALILSSCAPFTSSLYPVRSDSSPKRLGSEYASLFEVNCGSVPLGSNGSDNVVNVRSGRLFSKDIDGDGDLDLIWIVAGKQKSAVVLINDGSGDFTEASDNTPYVAALEELLSRDDPSEQPSVQGGNRTCSLFSSPGGDVATSVIGWFVRPTNRSDPFSEFDKNPNQSAFLSDLRKRGPPLILS